ncbi:MAG: ABC transporter permease [Nitrospiraceae bacterium]
MGRYLIIRMVGIVPQLLLISLLAFTIMKAAPGDPVAALVGGSSEFMSEADHQRVAHNLGLDRPLIVQYGMWLNKVVQGDLGRSLKDGREIRGMLFEGLAATLILVGCAWGVLTPMAVSAGYWAGSRRHSWVDYILSTCALVSFATPAFWLGLILILIFSVELDLFPSAGQTSMGDASFGDQMQHLVLPLLTIVLTQVGPYIRLVRGSIQDILLSDFLRAAWARGLTSRTVVWRYLLPNALTPFITWIGYSFPLLVGGTFIVEWVFGWPGMGRMFLQAAIGRNYPVLMATVLITGLLVIAGNLFADLLVAWLNPKLRRGYGH